MQLARYRRRAGQIVYFNKLRKAGRSLLTEGFKAGVILDVRRAKEGIIYEISCGPTSEKRIVRLSRRAFSFHSPNGREDYQPLIGLTIYFDGNDKEGRSMIERGIKDGIVQSVLGAEKGGVFFEIGFGPFGQRKFSLFSRSSFKLIPHN